MRRAAVGRRALVRWLSLALVLPWLVAAAPDDRLNDAATPEGWLWQQVQAGKIADFNARCGTSPLDPRAPADARWADPCRAVDASVLRALLLRPDLAKQAPEGVRAIGMKVGGDLELENAHITAAELGLYASRLSGRLVLTNARFDGALALTWTAIDGATVAPGLQVGGNLMANNVSFGGPVVLINATVHGQLVLSAATFGPGQQLSAFGLDAGKDLLMVGTIFGGGAVLTEASVHGQVAMDSARFALGQQLAADQLQVGGNLFMRGATFGGPVGLQSAHIGRNLDLRGATLASLDLSGADVVLDFRLGGILGNVETRTRWDPPGAGGPALILRNTRVGNLQDDRRAWPASVVLEGFSYTHLGGFGGDGAQDMRGRDVAWWQRWLASDAIYSPQPYTQLANVLDAAGNRDAAASVRFFGRDRERNEALRGCVWLQHLGVVSPPPAPRGCDWSTWVRQSIVQVFIGYGIGDYTFRALDWALGLTVLGTAILAFAPGVRGQQRFKGRGGRGPRQRSLLWCFGASLSHLLPVVSLSKEFDDFFNDPEREKLHAWQHVAFAVLALFGWALGLFVVAAFSGLTQS